MFFSQIILFNSFEPTFGRNIVNWLNVFYGSTFVVLGLFIHDSIKNFISQLIVGYLVMIYIMRVMQQVNIHSFDNFMLRREQKNMFEMIV